MEESSQEKSCMKTKANTEGGESSRATKSKWNRNDDPGRCKWQKICRGKKIHPVNRQQLLALKSSNCQAQIKREQ